MGFGLCLQWGGLFFDLVLLTAVMLVRWFFRFGSFFCLQRFGLLEDHRRGVLPDGTQRTREGGNCRSGAASSPLPCPPRPPTPPLLTGLVWVLSNALTQVERWEKGFVQLKGREKFSLVYKTLRQVFYMSCTSNALKPLIQSQRTHSAKRSKPCNFRR